MKKGLIITLIVILSLIAIPVFAGMISAAIDIAKNGGETTVTKQETKETVKEEIKEITKEDKEKIKKDIEDKLKNDNITDVSIITDSKTGKAKAMIQTKFDKEKKDISKEEIESKTNSIKSKITDIEYDLEMIDSKMQFVN